MPTRRCAALLALLFVGAACQGPPTDDVVVQVEVEAGRPAYAARARAVEDELRSRLQIVVAAVRPEVQRVRDSLQADIAGMRIPLRLATKEPFMQRWGVDVQADYQAQIQESYAESREQLVRLYEEAMELGAEQGRLLAPARSPLDGGVTGTPLIDAGVEGFSEVLDGLFDFQGLDVSLQQDVLRRDELVEIFSTFGDDAADAQLGGRLALFVGGANDVAQPRARVVLRCHEDVDASTRSFFQVIRNRVMRGATVVHDSGWRALGPGEGVLGVEAAGRYLVGSGLAPALEPESEGFDSLHKMRVITDVQTGVLDQNTRLLGGVDWQLEFRVTLRGDVSWQLTSATPAFSAECAELATVISELRRLRGA